MMGDLWPADSCLPPETIMFHNSERWRAVWPSVSTSHDMSIFADSEFHRSAAQLALRTDSLVKQQDARPRW